MPGKACVLKTKNYFMNRSYEHLGVLERVPFSLAELVVKPVKQQTLSTTARQHTIYETIGYYRCAACPHPKSTRRRLKIPETPP